MQSDLLDLFKVGAIGTGGLFASVTLSDISHLVSIGVGLATGIYVCVKTYYLIKSGGKAGKE